MHSVIILCAYAKQYTEGIFDPYDIIICIPGDKSTKVQYYIICVGFSQDFKTMMNRDSLLCSITILVTVASLPTFKTVLYTCDMESYV